MPVHEMRYAPADHHAQYASKYGDQRRLDDDGDHHRPAGNPHQPERGDIAPPFLDFEHHDAKEKDGAGDNRNDSDRPVETTDDLKRARCFDGDVARAIRLESKCDVVDSLESPVDVC